MSQIVWRRTPCQWTPPTVQPVTQWKSVVCRADGRPIRSSQLSVSGFRTWPVTSSLYFAGWNSGQGGLIA